MATIEDLIASGDWKVIRTPSPFGGGKFIARYSLTDLDFFIRGDNLYYNANKVTDDPPVFEADDPPPTRPDAVISRFKAGTATNDDAVTLLKFLVDSGIV
jgi:hypothetical protein